MIGINLLVTEKPFLSSGYDKQDEISYSVSFQDFYPYPSYPLFKFNFAGTLVFWEGQCFMPSANHQLLLKDIAQALSIQDFKMALFKIQELRLAGGEFVCFVQTKKCIYCFNDLFGRLPIYRYQTGKQLFIGRSIAALRSNFHLVPNKISIAQTLWCGYSLQQQTIFDKVLVMDAACLLQVEMHSFQVSIIDCNYLDFSNRLEKNISEYARELTALFSDTCRRMVESFEGNFHLSLSGGQDSRSVLAGFQKAYASISASSFCLGQGYPDSYRAMQISKLSEVPWEQVSIAPDNNDDDWLIQLKAGLNYSGMAFIHPYLTYIGKKYEGQKLLTGDGGDKMLTYLGENASLHTLDELVSILLNRHGIMSAKQAAHMAGYHYDDLAQSVFDCVEKYPEASLNDRSIHFVLSERARKAYFEGEDRNRYFIWSTTPYYDPAFVKLAMQVPDIQKKGYRLYHNFMQHLAPEFINIPDANGAKLGSNFFHFQKRFQEQFRSMPSLLKSYLRAIHKFKHNKKFQPVNQLKGVPVPDALSFLKNDKLAQIVGSNTEAALHLRTILKTFA